MGKSRGVLATTSASSPQVAPAPASPSPEAVAAAQEFLLNELYEDFELIRSYAVSGREAADRGDREEIKLRLRVQLRDVFRHAVEVHNLLTPALAQKADA